MNRIALCLVSCCLVLLWMQYYLIAPLSEEAKQMHQQQLDPTQIIAIPYNLHRLSIYVLVTTCIAILQHGVPLLKNIFALIFLWGTCFCTMILCGASPYENLRHTALSALYLVILAFFLEPPLYYWSSSSNCRTSYVHQRLPPLQQQQQQDDNDKNEDHQLQQQKPSTSIVLKTTLAVTIPMQVLLLYDRGWQMQRWPVPVILGATIGWVLGNLICAVASSRQQQQHHPGQD